VGDTTASADAGVQDVSPDASLRRWCTGVWVGHNLVPRTGRMPRGHCEAEFWAYQPKRHRLAAAERPLLGVRNSARSNSVSRWA
jgi:hypothetical protein